MIKGINAGEKNGGWKGDKVGYLGLHQGVTKRFPKPEVCDICKKVPPYDLANKGIYNRELKNWGWLCRRCHLESDGRMDFLKKGRAGETNSFAKLTQKQVDEIRATRTPGMRRNGTSFKDLAEKYGVVIGTIEAIIYGRTWLTK